MKVLISGAGIAGPTLAYWLARYGFETTIVERRPGCARAAIIDFWGAGFDIVERMELLPEILSKGYTIQELRVVGSSGRRVAGFSTSAISQVMGGRFLSLPRGDLVFGDERLFEKYLGYMVAGFQTDGYRAQR